MAQHAGGMGILAWRTFVALFRGQVSMRDFVGQLLRDGRAEPAPGDGHVDPVRHRDLAAGRIPVHGLRPSLHPRERRDLQRDPRARAGADGRGRDRPRGGAHHRGAGDDAGLRADRRPLLAGPRPGEGAGRSAHPGRHAGHDPARRDREPRRPPGRDAGRAAHGGPGPIRPSSTAPGSSGTTTTSSIRR